MHCGTRAGRRRVMTWVVRSRLIRIGMVAAIILLWWTQRELLRGHWVASPQMHPLTLERIQTLSVLTTLRVEVADARVTEIQGYTGSIKAVLVIRGEVNIGVDLSRARFESIDQDARTATLVLPEPAVQSARLDQQRTKLIGAWPTGLWVIVPGGQEADVVTVNRAYRDAERSVSEAANDALLIERSRMQAEQVLRAFFEALGWTVKFQRDL